MNINATLFVQALSFAFLIWFAVKFIWPPLNRAIDERNKRIADGLAAAGLTVGDDEVRASQGKKPIEVGIGVNTGTVVVIPDREVPTGLTLQVMDACTAAGAVSAAARAPAGSARPPGRYPGWHRGRRRR